MKLTLKTARPRNPLVVPSLRRHAGAHRSGPSAQRQQARRALRDEIDRLRESP